MINNIPDLEQTPLKKSKIQMEYEKVIKILVIGDTDCGKTAFLNSQCQIELKQQKSDSQENQQIQTKKTKGCDVHILEHIPEYSNLVHDPQQNAEITNKKVFGKNRLIFQFYDLSGEKSSRDYINIYTKDNISQFKAILYFFDVTNLKTLKNFHKWLKHIYHSQSSNMSYNYVWNTPFLMIGTKMDCLSKKYQEKIKTKIFSSISNIFQCTDGENFLLLSNKSNDFIQLKMFNLFLSQLSLEFELNKKQLNGSEYNKEEIDKLNKKSSKYTLNPNFYYNKYQIMDTDSLIEEFRQTISYKFEALKQKINICNFCKKRYNSKKDSNNMNNESSVLIVSK